MLPPPPAAAVLGVTAAAGRDKDRLPVNSLAESMRGSTASTAAGTAPPPVPTVTPADPTPAAGPAPTRPTAPPKVPPWPILLPGPLLPLPPWLLLTGTPRASSMSLSWPRKGCWLLYAAVRWAAGTALPALTVAEGIPASGSPAAAGGVLPLSAAAAGVLALASTPSLLKSYPAVSVLKVC